MAILVSELFGKMLALIDELLPNGSYDASKVADYQGRFPKLVDMVQKELLKVGDYYGIHEFSRYPTPNMFGHSVGFDIQEYKANEDLIFECVNDSLGGVKAYYFEADSGDGTAYIEDYTGSWNILATVNLTNTGDGFVAYKGAVTPTVGATKTRIRFSGSYYYRVVNRALFNIPFESGKIPDYQPFVKITLPTAVKSIDSVVAEYPERQYSKDSFYKIEKSANRQYLYIDYYFKGEVRVQYIPIPSIITALTDYISIDDVTANLICYKVASIIMASEQNEYLAGMFLEIYNELKQEASIKQPAGTTEIVDIYGVVIT